MPYELFPGGLLAHGPEREVRAADVWDAAESSTSSLQRGLVRLHLWDLSRDLPDTVRMLSVDRARSLRVPLPEWADAAFVFAFEKRAPSPRSTSGPATVRCQLQYARPQTPRSVMVRPVSSYGFASDDFPMLHSCEWTTLFGDDGRDFPLVFTAMNGSRDRLAHLVFDPIQALALAGTQGWAKGDRPETVLACARVEHVYRLMREVVPRRPTVLHHFRYDELGAAPVRRPRGMNTSQWMVRRYRGRYTPARALARLVNDLARYARMSHFRSMGAQQEYAWRMMERMVDPLHYAAYGGKLVLPGDVQLPLPW